MTNLPSIEDLLKKTGAKTPSQNIPQNISEEETITEKFEEKMSEIRVGEKESETKRAAKIIGVNYVNLKGFAISPEALQLIPKQQAESLKVISFLFTGPELRVGALDPTNPDVQELVFQLAERNKTNAIAYKISEESFKHALKLYDALPKIKKIVKGVKITEDELIKYRKLATNFEAVQKMLDDASTTDILTIVTAAALELGTSDIHIEAEESGVHVRLRVDGILQDVAKLPPKSWKKIISRIKLIAGLKINIADRPQDGRFTIFLTDEKVEVRTSTLPTAYGESVVMRLLRSGSIKLDFEQLGFRPVMFEKLNKEITKPHGMIITTGPTGSGKTTTLYSILRKLNTPGVKIITLEDPIEYKVEGLNQSQIDHTKDYTFAKGLRSILRQDPDIVMVGEIRDLETAEIAIQAALTGHLMLSTIHTNDAAGAIPRFLSMGVKPFLLAPALNAIVGQRLVRKICEACKEEVRPEPAVLERVNTVIAEIPENSGEKVDTANIKFYKGKGCAECNGTGYKGRIGIYELLLMAKEVERQILSGSVSEYQMRDIAKAQGMLTMVQDGILKVLDGVTTVDEVFRVTS